MQEFAKALHAAYAHGIYEQWESMDQDERQRWCAVAAAARSDEMKLDHLVHVRESTRAWTLATCLALVVSERHEDILAKALGSSVPIMSESELAGFSGEQVRAAARQLGKQLTKAIRA